MQAYWPHLLAVLVGVGLTVQVGMNLTLGRAVGSSLWAAVGNFSVGLVALVACAALFSGRVATGSIAQVPGWAWWGGLFGASYVASATMLGPRLGAVALLVLVLAGQLVSALWVDQFGVLGFPRIPVTPLRLLGAALVVVGAVLVVRR